MKNNFFLFGVAIFMIYGVTAQKSLTNFHSNGKLRLTGMYIIKNGDTINKLEVGLWKEYYKTGQLMESTFYNNKGGEEDGPYKYYYKSGQLQEYGFYHKGEKDGYWYTYFENNTKKTIKNYNVGKKNGDWTRYYKSGKLEAKATYNKDSLVSPWVNLTPKGNIIPEGISMTFYINGNKKSVKDTNITHNGKQFLDGISTHYYSNGSIKKKYELHKEHATIFHYFENNTLNKVSYIEYGSKQNKLTFPKTNKVGLWKEYNLTGKLVAEKDWDLSKATTYFQSKKFNEAHTYFLKSALNVINSDKNIMKAQFALGIMNENGLGMDKNVDKAHIWYEKCGDLGYINGYYNIAAMYINAANTLLKQMNELGISDGDKKNYNKLKTYVDTHFNNSITYLEKAYKVKGSKMSSPALKMLLDLYTRFGIENETQKEIKKLIEKK